MPLPLGGRVGLAIVGGGNVLKESATVQTIKPGAEQG